MDEAQLQERIRLGEDSTTEFKSVARSGFLVDAGDLAKEISAMANGEGGTIFLGVEDDGSTTGVGNPAQADALMRHVSQVYSDRVRPALVCPIAKVQLAGGVIVMTVSVPSRSPDRPFQANGIHYIRDANRCRAATPAELRRIYQSADHHYDEQPLSGAVRSDLDSDAVAQVLSVLYGSSAPAGREDRYLQSLKCLATDGVPTVAGILFFAAELGRFMPDAAISAVRFQGTEMTGQFADRLEIDGRLATQIEQAASFLDRHLRSPSSIEGWQRVGIPGPGAIPDIVLREAVLNALTHRDYRAASQVKLFVFDDRVQITNPGGLLNALDLDNIRLGGISQKRNPTIASILSRLKRRENLGIGVPEMFRLMREHGLPEPELSLPAGHFQVVLRASPTRDA